ncbi:MAG TPA: YfiR family protein [Opitutaceae bacterium]|nr:YfiR family protein [Opitutaceae bacterium]
MTSGHCLHPWLRPLGWIGVIVLASTAFGAAESRPRVAPIEAVYAAFTINLTRFITWPAAALGAPGEPFLIGSFPRDPINPDLDEAVRGETVAGHPVRTIRVGSLADVLRCRVVFLSRGVADPGRLLAETRGHPILTISDAAGFLEHGGHVRFVSKPPHTRLEISAVNLRNSRLEARAQLLRLAALP